jgi:glyoxylase-like metal-dependent hydrolase (beta-lactamase superfamily II)
MEVRRIELRGVNAYLVNGDTLLDAGWTWSASSVQEAVERDGGSLSDVKKVLITHYDIDHVGGLARLADAGLEAPVYVSEPDASFLKGEKKPPLRNRKGVFQRAVGVGIRPPSLPVERVEDGDEVAGFEVCETPGHTPGHVAYLGEDDAFLGDAVRENDGDFEHMPSLMSYDTEEAHRSVEKLVRRIGDVTAYVGHGGPVENASERLSALSQGRM